MCPIIALETAEGMVMLHRHLIVVSRYTTKVNVMQRAVTVYLVNIRRRCKGVMRLQNVTVASGSYRDLARIMMIFNGGTHLLEKDVRVGSDPSSHTELQGIPSQELK